MITLPVRVVNESGEPVAGVKVIPWALRCSQGHGSWHEKTLGKLPEFTTDDEGRAEVTYPRYVSPDEFVRTTEVTLSVDQRDYVYISHENVNVPRGEQVPHEITLHRGATVEITPLENGKPAEFEGLYAVWSDNRPSQTDGVPVKTQDGHLQRPAMPPGSGQVLLARIIDGRATHFSSIIDLELKAQERLQREVDLRPAVQISGMLSDNVPRPVKNGRVAILTLEKDPSKENVNWVAWSTVAEDGSFKIEAWPAGETLQLIALSDGYIAESGVAPAVAKPPRQPDPFNRPQVFLPDSQSEPLIVKMVPMVECRVDVVNEDNTPLSGVEVASCPNVGWWNYGSQIYCGYLHSSEKYLVTRDIDLSVDSTLPAPFTVTTDEKGRTRLFLPVGKEDLYAGNDDYELPINRGRRDVEVELIAGETAQVRLVLQRKGKEFLGEWDKLAGVLFGCTGDECRRLLEDPGFRKRITGVRLKLDEAENATDPDLLRSAFAEISAAFDEVDDEEEANRWRRKADEQAANLEKGRTEPAKKP
ncbi:MAG: hypothetical protein SH868_08670 [Bythopirellula sp.]|nr:hypothetical protein [Bythopirellula sp.]